MNPRETSLTDVVLLIVFAQALNVWWSADSPYNGAKQMSKRSLRRYEIGATSFTVTYGIFASLLTKRATPVVVSLMLSLAFAWLYEYEWAHANEEPAETESAPAFPQSEEEAQLLTATVHDSVRGLLYD